MKLKEKIKHHHEPGEHFWECLKKYNMSFDEQEDISILENDPKDISKILKKLNSNEYLETITLPANEVNTKKFLQYIEMLKDYGLDIGKGDSEYGFKMPIHKKGENIRKLIIFKRWKK